MLRTNKLWIIANENTIHNPVFYKEISTSSDFNNGIREFINKYQLGINITNDDIYLASYLLADMGNMVVIKDVIEKETLFYIPSDVSSGQLKWTVENKRELTKDTKIDGFVLSDNVSISKEAHDFNTIVNILNQNHISSYVNKIK